MEDFIMVAIDYRMDGKDRPVLMASRRIGGDDIDIVNTLMDDEAIETYCKLVGKTREEIENEYKLGKIK